MAGTSSIHTCADRCQVDIQHGIHDGHGSAPVPVSQSLIAFNALATAGDRFTDQQIAYITKERKIPPQLATAPGGDQEKILLRSAEQRARLTIFDGGHDKNTEAGVRWLNRQRK